MTLHIEEVRSRIDYIRSVAGDPEAAHSAEDELHADVLRYVLDNSPAWSSMHQLAEAALSTADIPFPRHTA